PDRPAHYRRRGFRLTLTAHRYSYEDIRTSLGETRGLHIRGGERSDSTPYSHPGAQRGRERSRSDGPYGCGLTTSPRSVGKRRPAEDDLRRAAERVSVIPRAKNSAILHPPLDSQGRNCLKSFPRPRSSGG